MRSSSDSGRAAIRVPARRPTNSGMSSAVECSSRESVSPIRQSAATPGFDTDRGRVYLMFGPPDSIETQAAGADQIDVWRYANVAEIGEDFRVRFSSARGTYCGFRIVSPAPIATRRGRSQGCQRARMRAVLPAWSRGDFHSRRCGESRWRALGAAQPSRQSRSMTGDRIPGGSGLGPAVAAPVTLPGWRWVSAARMRCPPMPTH